MTARAIYRKLVSGKHTGKDLQKLLSDFRDIVGCEFKPTTRAQVEEFKRANKNNLSKITHLKKKYGDDFEEKMTEKERLFLKKSVDRYTEALLELGYTKEQWRKIHVSSGKNKTDIDLQKIKWALNERDEMIKKYGSCCAICGKLLPDFPGNDNYHIGQRAFFIPDTKDNIKKYGYFVINARENIIHTCLQCQKKPNLHKDNIPEFAKYVQTQLKKRQVKYMLH